MSRSDDAGKPATRAALLAEQFDAAVATFVATMEELTDEQWRTMCPGEERTVAALARHVAGGIVFEMNVFRELAAGRQPSTVTWPDLDRMNAERGRFWQKAPREETLAALRENGAAAAAEVRRFNNQQLERSGKYIEEEEPLTVERWIQRILIGHVTGHLQSIQATLGLEAGTGN